MLRDGGIQSLSKVFAGNAAFAGPGAPVDLGNTAFFFKILHAWKEYITQHFPLNQIGLELAPRLMYT